MFRCNYPILAQILFITLSSESISAVLISTKHRIRMNSSWIQNIGGFVPGFFSEWIRMIEFFPFVILVYGKVHFSWFPDLFRIWWVILSRAFFLLFLIYIFTAGVSKFGWESSINLFVIHAVILGSVCGICDMGNIVSEDGYVHMKCDLYSFSDLSMPAEVYAHAELHLAPDQL